MEDDKKCKYTVSSVLKLHPWDFIPKIYSHAQNSKHACICYSLACDNKVVIDLGKRSLVVSLYTTAV